MNAGIFKCELCKQDAPEAEAVRDTDLNEVVCEACRKDLRNAKAVLATPFDQFGNKISIKGCYKSGHSRDNQ